MAWDACCTPLQSGKRAPAHDDNAIRVFIYAFTHRYAFCIVPGYLVTFTIGYHADGRPWYQVNGITGYC